MAKTSRRRVKRSRQSLPKEIAAKSHIDDKLTTATGVCSGSLIIDGNSDDARLNGLILTANKLAACMKDPKQVPHFHKSPQSYYAQTCAILGFELWHNIVRRDYRFFSRLAAKLQFPEAKYKKDADRRRYARILIYCLNRDCGTEENPCDGRALAQHLRSLGDIMVSPYATAVPRVLADVCKKIGVVLKKLPPGRPRKTPQR